MHPAQPEEPARRDREARAHHVRPVEAFGEHGPGRCEHRHTRHRHQRPERRRERAQAQHTLQVLGEEDREPDRREHGQQVGEQRAAEGGAAQQCEVHHRVFQALLTQYEDDTDDQARDDAERGKRGVSVRRQLLDAPDDGQQRGEREHRAQQVEPAAGRCSELREQQRAEDQQQRHGRQVDQEDRAPPEVGEQQSADHRAERDTGGHHRRPQGDRLAPLPLVAEEVADQREGRRHQRGSAHTEQRPYGDELSGAVGVGGGDRCRAEEHRAREHQPAASDAVAERAHRDQQPGEYEAVHVEHPQLLGGARFQVPADVRDGEVEDGDVHGDEEQREHQHGECDPLPAARCWSCRGGWFGYGVGYWSVRCRGHAGSETAPGVRRKQLAGAPWCGPSLNRVFAANRTSTVAG